MKIALVITVKNEERILRDNLIYHNALGISKAFVYLDKSTDGTKESIQDLDFVTISDSVVKEKYASLEYLHKFIATYETHHTARQCLNTFDAKQSCQLLGIDWLISIDADELIVLNRKIFEFNSLPNFFTILNSDVDEVNFKTFEVVAKEKKYNNVFAE